MSRIPKIQYINFYTKYQSVMIKFDKAIIRGNLIYYYRLWCRDYSVMGLEL